VIRVTRIVEHHFALGSPAASARGTWTERRSLLIVVEDAAGNIGLGEAAPLPGYSRDTLEAARSELGGLLGRQLPPRDEDRACGVDLRHASAALVNPSARAAVESALLDVWAREAGVPAWSLLGDHKAPSNVPVAVWLPEGTESALQVARYAHEHGTRAFKVKLDGRTGLASGLATLRALREALGTEVALRADANQSATAAQLEASALELRELALEWFEEPTAEPLPKSLGIPLALDESLAGSTGFPDLDTSSDVVALVLKLTALGGFGRALGLAGHARTHGRAAVASHLLEGAVGFMASASLAFALPQGRAHGLGGYGPFARNSSLPALAAGGEHLVRWDTPGFGLNLDQALAHAEHDHSENA
jgi:O-succinylbenzoate synthase